MTSTLSSTLVMTIWCPNTQRYPWMIVFHTLNTSTLSREYTPEHSPDYGRAGLRGVVEQGVPIRQQ